MYTALLDSNILYSSPLRDILIEISTNNIYRPRWSNHIHVEWIRNLLKNRPDLTHEKLQRTRLLIDRSGFDSLITGYEYLISCLDLPDKNDNHVLAAAIAGRCDVIVTMNIKHFPLSKLQPHNIDVQHPDEFMAHLYDLEPDIFIEAVKTVRLRLKNPPLSVEEYIKNFNKSDFPAVFKILQDNLYQL